MNERERISLSLKLLRLSVFLVMFVWTLDKLLNPEHAARVFENFYGLDDTGRYFLAIVAILELLLLAGFVIGYRKRLTYGLVLLFHGVSTLSSYAQYMDPFSNLLFFAAWPMLAACFALYLLRDLDVRWTISSE